MKYINKVSGEIRDFVCTIKSNNWEPVEAPKALNEEKEKPVKRTTKKA